MPKRKTSIQVKIAYQILKASEGDGESPFKNFPARFNNLAGQYGICTNQNNTDFDQAQYDFQKGRVEEVLCGMIRDRAKKAQTPKPAGPPHIPIKRHRKNRDERTLSLPFGK